MLSCSLVKVLPGFQRKILSCGWFVIEAKGSSEMSLLFCQTTLCHPRRQYPAWSLPLENQISHKFKRFDDGFMTTEAVLLDAVQIFIQEDHNTVGTGFSFCLAVDRI